jgi:hypothetical protein
MQRTALQGSPKRLAALTRSWIRGAPAPATERHPFRLHFDELAMGDTIETAARTVTLEDIEHFAHFTGDTFYAHMDEEAAAANPFFPGRVAHGYLILSFAAGLFVDPAPGPVLANYGLDNCVPEAGLARRRDPRAPDCQGEERGAPAGIRRGALGRGGGEPKRRDGRALRPSHHEREAGAGPAA